MEVDNSYNYSVNADGKASALIPVELLWTEDHLFFDKKIENETDAWRVNNKKWASKSILRLRPHIDLFGFLAIGLPTYPSEYLRWYEEIFASRGMTPPMNESALLQHRLESYRIFSNELCRHGIDSPALQIRAKFDSSRNVFIIEDGHHRACFLHSRGFRCIPVQIPYGDLQEWLNLPYLYHVEQTIRSQDRRVNYTPILNPMAGALRVERDFAYKSRLDHILYFFGAKDFSGSILDVGSNTGFYSFHFSREGMQVVGCEPDPNHYDLSLSLSNLYRLNATFTRLPAADYLMTGQIFDGALLLTVLYHLINRNEHNEFLDLLNSKISDYIIWESGGDPELEKNLILNKTKFSEYAFIANTYATGKARELGVFSRKGWLISQ